MTHTRRLQILRNLEPGLMLRDVADRIKVSRNNYYKLRKLCTEAGYEPVNGSGTISKRSVISNPKLTKRYKNMQWDRGLNWLQKRHKISRQTLSQIRQQLDFISLFTGTKKLTYKQCVKEMRDLQDFRRGLAPAKCGRRFKDLKVEEYLRWGKLLGIEVGK